MPPHEFYLIDIRLSSAFVMDYICLRSDCAVRAKIGGDNFNSYVKIIILIFPEYTERGKIAETKIIHLKINFVTRTFTE
jgi:hypothetical protein